MVSSIRSVFLFRVFVFSLAMNLAITLFAESPEQSFEEFKQAVKQKDGKKAAQLLSQETVKVYEQYRQGALRATTKEDLEQLPTLEVIGILSHRHHFSKKELKESTGLSLLEKATTMDPATNKLLAQIEIVDVTYSKKTATATLKVGDKPIPDVVMVFRKQNGKWKWDMDHYSSQAADRFEKLRKDWGLSKVDFARKLLREQYGRKVSDKIVNGPIARGE